MKHGLMELGQLLGRHQALLAVSLPAVSKAVWTLGIVAPHQPVNPVSLVAADLSDLARAPALCAQRDRLPVDLFDGVVTLAEAFLQLGDGEMRRDRRQLRHDDPRGGDRRLMIQLLDLVQGDSVSEGSSGTLCGTPSPHIS